MVQRGAKQREQHPLRVWLRQHGYTMRAFAQQVGTTGPYVQHILAGRSWPSAKLALRIEKATGGEVRASSLVFYRRRHHQRPAA